MNSGKKLAIIIALCLVAAGIILGGIALASTQFQPEKLTRQASSLHKASYPVSEPFTALLGAYEAQLRFGLASIGGTVIGVFVISLLQEGIMAMRMTKEVQMIITGLIVIVFVYADVSARRRKN